MTVPDDDVVVAVAQAHRSEWGVVLAAVARLLDGDLGTAEECTQEAFEAALRTWGERGIPSRPGAWLTTTAKNRALDRVRREIALQARYPDLVRDEVDEGAAVGSEEDDDVHIDDRLRLVFTCCHPALADESRIALSLRLVCGLTTEEIARAFLVPEPTMAARITRSKKKIATAGIPYRVPGVDDLPERLDGVLTVIHLVFTAGYATSGERLVRADLVDRALDLARVLAVLMPREPEALGLLALFTTCLRTGVEPGRFLLQAAIAGAHDEATSWGTTDWPGIVMLYDRLLGVWPSPVVEVNRAAAVAFAVGLEDGLALLDALADRDDLRAWHYLPAARADLLRRLGRDDDAVTAYRAALATIPDGAERTYLETRLHDLLP